jgi:hypothetical protein
LALTDDQLQIVISDASGLSPEKRSVFLERLAARLRLRGSRFTDVDLNDAIRLALKGLIQESAA